MYKEFMQKMYERLDTTRKNYYDGYWFNKKRIIKYTGSVPIYAGYEEAEPHRIAWYKICAIAYKVYIETGLFPRQIIVGDKRLYYNMSDYQNLVNNEDYFYNLYKKKHIDSFYLSRKQKGRYFFLDVR